MICSYILLADMGGTNIRFATLYNDKVIDVRRYDVVRFEKIDDAIHVYMAEVNRAARDYKRAAFSIAAPLSGDVIDMTNNHWAFSKQDLQQAFLWDDLIVVNDFYAVAAAVPLLKYRYEDGARDSLLVLTEDSVLAGGGAQKGAPISVLGAGTGLGMAYLTADRSGHYTPVSTEGGHVTMAGHTPKDAAIFQEILRANPHYSHLSAERLISGKGIEHIYKALCHLNGTSPIFEDAAEISKNGTSVGGDPTAVEAMALFCRYYGSVAGDQALTIGAKGGVYIAGGVVLHFIDYFVQSGFYQAFLNKGRFQSYVETMPIYIMIDPNPAFVGLHAILKG